MTVFKFLKFLKLAGKLAPAPLTQHSPKSLLATGVPFPGKLPS